MQFVKLLSPHHMWSRFLRSTLFSSAVSLEITNGYILIHFVSATEAFVKIAELCKLVILYENPFRHYIEL